MIPLLMALLQVVSLCRALQADGKQWIPTEHEVLGPLRHRAFEKLVPQCVVLWWHDYLRTYPLAFASRIWSLLTYPTPGRAPYEPEGLPVRGFGRRAETSAENFISRACYIQILRLRTPAYYGCFYTTNSTVPEVTLTALRNSQNSRP